MLTPATRDLILYPGFTFNPLLEFFTDEGKTQAFNLSGYSAQLTVGNGTLVLTSASGLTLGGVLGTVQVSASAAQTAVIALAEYDWFLQWTSPGGEVDCPVSGTLRAQTP